MAYKTLFLKNTTASPILLTDLGIFLPANQTLEVTEMFSVAPSRLVYSTQLTTEVEAGRIVLNDGIEDILVAGAVAYLQWYSVPNHSVTNVVHQGNFPDLRVLQTDILARLSGTQSITGQWAFPNGLIIEYGTALPTQGIATGRLYWLTTTKRLNIGLNGAWIDIVKATVALYNAPLVYEYGYNQRTYSGSYLRTSWAASNLAPVIVPRAGSLKSIITDSNSSRDYDMTIQFYLNGSWQDMYTVASSGYYEIRDGLSIDFDAETRIACKVTSGRMYYPHAYLEVVWREQ